MDMPQAPVGMLVGLFKGAVDLWHMPGRIRVLAEAAKSAGDPRPRCPTCGDGHIATENTFLDGYHYAGIGACNRCEAAWVYWIETKAIYRVAEPADARFRRQLPTNARR